MLHHLVTRATTHSSYPYTMSHSETPNQPPPTSAGNSKDDDLCIKIPYVTDQLALTMGPLCYYGCGVLCAFCADPCLLDCFDKPNDFANPSRLASTARAVADTAQFAAANVTAHCQP